jgi:hypothetical protein
MDRLVSPRDLVGPGDIAALAFTSIQSVNNWRRRYRDFPKPLCRLSCGYVWSRDDVLPWLVSHGKLAEKRS